MYINNY